MHRAVVLFCFLLLLPSVAEGQATPTSTESPTSGSRMLTHEDYDRWNSFRGQTLSRDGSWLSYTVRPADSERDSQLKIRATDRDEGYVVTRGRSARFAPEQDIIVYLVSPDPKAVEEASEKKLPPDQRPATKLEILNLDSGQTTTTDRVTNFQIPQEAGSWIAYLRDRTMEEPEPAAEVDNFGAEESQAQESSEKTEESDENSSDSKKSDGRDLIVRSLTGRAELVYPHVTSYTFNREGTRLALATSSKSGDADALAILELGQIEPSIVLDGPGEYKRMTWDESGTRLGFLSNKDTYESDDPTWTLYCWNAESGEVKPLAATDYDGLKTDWIVSDNGFLRFSKDGSRLYFGTAPEPDDPDKADDDEKTESQNEEKKEPEVKVDVWHWQDPYLQPQQLLNVDSERRRTYLATVPTDGGAIVQLADELVPQVRLGAEGDADIALGISNIPYRIQRSWDISGPSDYYLIDVETGSRELVRKAFRGSMSVSVGGQYATIWDTDTEQWSALDLESREVVDLSANLPHPLADELHDEPSPPRPYGLAGWTEEDESVLIYDRYDVWAVDPTNGEAQNLTDGHGRESTIQMRVIDLDRDEPALDPEQPLLLSAFHETSKASGFYRDGFDEAAEPEELIMGDESFSRPSKADEGDVLIFTRQTFRKFPDLWTSGLDFKEPERLTDVNPQQSEYRWGSPELVSWMSEPSEGEGQELQGILIKPDGFDPSKSYPMIVYFYERLSDRLHRYTTPAPARASVNLSFYASRGYVLFLPDIPYRIGEPGPSACEAILPGVKHVLSLGFVDPERVGIQGHSWGGYQVAYLVTKTNMFAAAESGAPVSNMTSAYGGIRWSSGYSRMFQYEQTQSRIGATLWDDPEKYILNSPLFQAPKIETPLLILHNDRDGAVPWYQGIELFVAMRRLGKPAWMLNYNGEQHGLTRDQNQRDWSIRMQQFFDHYLKDEPAPVWLAEGVPAVDKGKTLGLELVEPEPTSAETPEPEPEAVTDPQ